MGTNYYLHDKPACPTCGHESEPRHIGKSSAGWCFSLHVIPEDGINDLADWEREWSKPGAVIRDEYGETVEPERMRRIIAERNWQKAWDEPWWRNGFHDYGSEETFHARNFSQRGPNGLLRHALGRHCIGHGAGTWDLIPGEFS